jgi:hypothetical protein
VNLFQLGSFVLNSGAISPWKLECDALEEGSIVALAKMISILVGPFSSVEGVPRGGLQLAQSLKQYVSTGEHPHLIVDDVLTTGGSLIRARTAFRLEKSASKEVIGAVVFARGPCPSWVKAVFQMPSVFWLSV